MAPRTPHLENYKNGHKSGKVPAVPLRSGVAVTELFLTHTKSATHHKEALSKYSVLTASKISHKSLD